MSFEYAPILIFTYKRIATLKTTIDCLKRNKYSSLHELYIFSDGPKTDSDVDSINEVRKFIKSVNGFKNIYIRESTINKGLANSIIDGVSEIINIYGKVIVLEDDLMTSPNFLAYMNLGLNHYINNSKVFSVSGFTMPIKGLQPNSIYFTKRASCWGWATWADRWGNIDWAVKNYEDFNADSVLKNRFNEMGSDMSNMLNRQMSGEINSWAIRWCFHQFMNDLYTVFPAISKVINIGLEDPNATHTNEKFNRFKTFLDYTNNEHYLFTDNVELDGDIIKQFIRPYSIQQRIKYKILNALF
ncbi:glycosyltransferase [Spirosoma terrae]|uniref:Glycosyltransferase family 2 protein n=1 Tax=Spirosoma terrae TaxID=1968276 RepID=A0A6L9LAL0_9BACT|nr:glycosyltransferase [Spirosoma terrae]NDU97574.1 glycosyltransferase family 2 protein [Spirosoma terrae]